MEPEFMPKLKDDIFDVSNFDKEFTHQKPRYSKINKQTKDMIKDKQDLFAGFDSWPAIIYNI